MTYIGRPEHSINGRPVQYKLLINGNHALTVTGKLKKPSIITIGPRIIAAWGKIESESIVKEFEKCF